MARGCVALLADTDTHEALGRMANAITTAREFADAGDDAVVLFDGAGPKWVPCSSPMNTVVTRSMMRAAATLFG